MRKRMRVFVHGHDGMGWSIDSDRNNLMAALHRCGLKLIYKPFLANAIHSLWWNSFIDEDVFYFKYFTQVNATCSNFIDPDSEYFFLHDRFNKAKNIVDIWICPSTKQKIILDRLNLKTYYMPFFIDYEFFSHNQFQSQREIFARYHIPAEIFRGKCVIGSFLRDTLGADLSKPKFQKNPDGLINILKNLDRTKYILLLAGPRRHYILKQCRTYNIPYFYIGTETIQDDIDINTSTFQTVRDLYSITDISICTSVSEGGPKSILEASATKTLCISTDVGLARDFLHEDMISNDYESLGKILYEYVNDKGKFIPYIDHAHKLCEEKLSNSSKINYIRALYG